MAQSIREVMTFNPVSLPAGSPLAEAAHQMKEHDIGDVIVLDDRKICGVVTDRDIVVRAIAEDRDPKTTKLADICSRDLIVLSPDDTAERATQLMREYALRRIPVVENDKPVGIVSIGDLTVQRDPESALADISTAPANT